MHKVIYLWFNKYFSATICRGGHAKKCSIELQHFGRTTKEVSVRQSRLSTSHGWSVSRLSWTWAHRLTAMVCGLASWRHCDLKRRTRRPTRCDFYSTTLKILRLFCDMFRAANETWTSCDLHLTAKCFCNCAFLWVTISLPAAKEIRQREFCKKVTTKVTEAPEKVTKKWPKESRKRKQWSNSFCRPRNVSAIAIFAGGMKICGWCLQLCLRGGGVVRGQRSYRAQNTGKLKATKK